MSTFSEAVLAHDMDRVEALLADDVVFHSPVAFPPYPGKALTAEILRAVSEVFQDFRYVRELGEEGGDQVLVFEASVNGLQLTGCDLLRHDEAGRIVDLEVMVRPLRAAEALARAMADRFDGIRAAVAARSSEQQGR